MGEDDEAFLAQGDQLVDMIERHCGLTANSRVLDVGCGYGRLAHALLRRGFEGTYLGIDVQSRVTRWCAKALGSERFGFRHVDLQNGRYNPDGQVGIRELELGRREYDVVCAFSLFTHVWPEDVEAYFDVFRRVLTRDGTALATFFLIDDEWRRLEAEGKVALRLPHSRGEACRYESESEPLHHVAYDLPWLIKAGFIAGLLPKAPPEFGFWSWRPVARERPIPYQDLLAFRLA